MDNIPWWKKPGVIIAGIIGVLLAIIFGEKKRADKAEGAAESADVKAKDAALAQKQEDLQVSSEARQTEADRLQKAKEALGREELSPEEVKKYWENK